MATWAEQEIIMPSGPYEDFPFLADRLPYSRLLLENLGKWPRSVITGPTQSGKSFHAFVLVIMYYLFERGESVIAGIPDINMAADKWQEDIKPVIERSSYAHLLPDIGAGSKGATKLTKITFRNGKFLRFMSSGGNDKQRAGATARILICTETDGMDVVASTSQEGQTKIQQLEGRVRAFGDEALMFFECTTSTKKAFTRREYESGTASRIVHPCKSCGEYVSPEREHLIGWKDAQDAIEAGRNGRFTCPNCGVFYSEQNRIDMNQQSVLLHAGQEIDREGNITGEIRQTDTFGFRWSGFQNLLTSTEKLCREEWTAAKAEDPVTANIARLQQVWALPAENPNVERVPLNAAIVRGSEPRFAGRLSGIPRGQVPDGNEVLTAFIDCGKRELQWAVESKLQRRIHVVDYGIFETDRPDEKADEVAVSDAVKDLIEQLNARFPDLQCGLVDSGNWPDAIRTAVSMMGGIWHPSHGLPQYRHPKLAKEGDKEIPADGSQLWHWSNVGGVWVANFNPDAIKHRIQSGLLIVPLDEHGNRPSGAVTLFGSDPNEHTDYALELTAEEWVTEFIAGKGQVSRWNPIRKRNHYFDTAVGNHVARLIVKNWTLLESQPVPQVDASMLTDPRLERFLR